MSNNLENNNQNKNNNKELIEFNKEDYENMPQGYYI